MGGCSVSPCGAADYCEYCTGDLLLGDGVLVIDVGKVGRLEVPERPVGGCSNVQTWRVDCRLDTRARRRQSLDGAFTLVW